MFDAMCCSGTERARGRAQTLLNVPYGEGDGEKLDVYIPKTNSLGTDSSLHFMYAETSVTHDDKRASPPLFQTSTLLFTCMEATGSFSGTADALSGIYLIF